MKCVAYVVECVLVFKFVWFNGSAIVYKFQEIAEFHPVLHEIYGFVGVVAVVAKFLLAVEVAFAQFFINLVVAYNLGRNCHIVSLNIRCINDILVQVLVVVVVYFLFCNIHIHVTINVLFAIFVCVELTTILHYFFCNVSRIGQELFGFLVHNAFCQPFINVVVGQFCAVLRVAERRYCAYKFILEKCIFVKTCYIFCLHGRRVAFISARADDNS